MPYRLTPFQTGSYYHIFNRGVEKRKIFTASEDYARFLETIYFYRFSGPKPKLSTRKRFKTKEFYNNPKIVEVICYCLMPNHFHLLLKQVIDNGIHEFMSKVSNSYTKYFNTKRNRVGPLLQGQFKAVLIETDEQLTHVSRYIHLNPYVAELTKELENFEYSSYPEFVGLRNNTLSNPQSILNFFSETNSYKDFVRDYESYATDLRKIEHLLLE